jgi:natural product precursor
LISIFGSLKLIISISSLKIYNLMKKIKFESKLSLKKETVARLNEAQMGHLKGGAWFTLYHCNKTNNCGTATCPTGTCPTASCGASCQTECPSIQQSACNGNICP